MTTLTEQRALAIEQAKNIVARAKAQQRGVTKSEMDQIRIKMDLVQGLKSQIDDEQQGHDLFDKLMAVDARAADGGQVLGLSGASRTALGRDIAAKMLSGGPMGKALMPSGSVVTTTPLLPDPIPLGKVPSSLLDALTVTTTAPTFAFLRQGSRVNNAAPVAEGDQKPVSAYGLVRVESKLEVVAHLSEKVPFYWLEDSTALATFVSNELIYGLARAVEGQIVNGSGVSPQLDGILASSGILVQPAVDDDLLTTTRSAITALENVGHTPGLFVLSPADWQRIELSRTSGSGELELTTPVDRARQQLWGVQVVTTTAPLPADTALLLDRSAVVVNTDGQGVRVTWNPWSDFGTNEVTARCEGRYQVSLLQPAGACKITLPTAVVTP